MTRRWIGVVLASAALACGPTGEAARVATPSSARADGSASSSASSPRAPRREAELDAVDELDGRVDALSAGDPMRLPSGGIHLLAPKTWVVAAGGDTDHPWVRAAPPTTGSTSVWLAPDHATEKDVLDATAQCGVTSCAWAPPRAVVVGIDKLQATVQTGACARDGAPVHAALLRIPDAPLVLGVWTAREEGLAVFGTMRAAARGTLATASCCAALSSAISSAPPAQKLLYAAASAVCNGSKANPGGASLSIQATLAGAPTPAACK
ncbi:MAG: hypothetical protein U0414_41225 [Polyangiaceae bacterium]